MANRLKQEKSPYLLQHGDNPVDWFPWCREAFEKAAAEDKPVFLSIGYSTCHWCHVMAHESFEDADVAALLNRDYVCIKVDREERPDIDAVYMAVCQALTGSGGWPLTVLMTAEQKPFFAGTYFPKEGRFGQTGLTELLRRISHLWRTQREKLLEAGDSIAEAIGKPSSRAADEPTPALLHKAFALFRQSFDPRWGGFGVAPKFPSPHNLLLLLYYARLENEPAALHMAETTLKAMAAGGLFDHIGGGFSRYATDDKWLIPHFEKMLYDNALLLIAYLSAYQFTGDAFYAEVARRTADYMLRELYQEEGGFFCGQDADSDGVEGKYYTFTPEEVGRVLGKADAEAFCRLYGITQAGNFEGASVPNRIGVTEPAWDGGDPRLLRLYEYRKSRVRLHTDDKVLLSWNGWAVIAMCMAGEILDEPRFRDAARRTQRFIEERMTRAEGRLFLRYRDGEAAQEGQLDDYAVYAMALLALYRATFDSAYLELALCRARQMIALFEDASDGGYFMSAADAEQLIVRPKESYDGAIPSGNAVAAMVLEVLAQLTGEQCWRDAADRQHRFLSGQAGQYPAGFSFGLLAMAKRLYPHKELLCASGSVPQELTAYLRKNPAFGLSVIVKTNETAASLARCAPFTKDYPVPGEGTLWYLCENGACKTPESEFARLQL